MNEIKKMTSKSAINYVLTNYKDTLPDDVAEKLGAMLTSLEKKSTAPKKPTEEQLKSLAYYEVILANLSDTPETVSDMIKRIPEICTCSSQKITPIMATLVSEGKAIKSVIKGRSRYSKAVVGD